MSDQRQIAPETAALNGDLEALAEKLGPSDALSLLTPAISEKLQRINTVEDLRAFLQSYREERLFTHELPVILQAYQHGSRSEARELIALDQTLSQNENVKPLASASRQVGRSQLRRLRPMKDVRVVQRYLTAIENSEANGWHTVVYGLLLSLFSLPLRQGLVNYAFQTVRAFVYSAARRLSLTELECQKLIAEFTESLATPIEHILQAHGATMLRLTE